MPSVKNFTLINMAIVFAVKAQDSEIKEAKAPVSHHTEVGGDAVRNLETRICRPRAVFITLCVGINWGSNDREQNPY
jgi:hypothetical protein